MRIGKYFSSKNRLGNVNSKQTGNVVRWRRLVLFVIFSLMLILAGWLVVDRWTLVQPSWPDSREGEPVPERPDSDDPLFYREPMATTLEERKGMYLEWAAGQPTPDGRNAVWAEILKMESSQEGIDSASLQGALDFVDDRNDCADFVVGGLLRLYYLYAGTEYLTEEQEKAIKQTLLDYKYWLDEPDPTQAAMELYTENHQIMSFSGEYLAGQLFPDETFSNVNRDGEWRKERARERILEWMDWRVRTGFAEWDSIPYYSINLAALLNIVDFAEDEKLAKRAAMMVDLILFDIVVDSFYGQYGTSHGRISSHHVKSAAGDSLVTSQALLWGMGRFQTISNLAAVSLATTEEYELPPVLEEIALHQPEEMLNYERHSINVTEEVAEKYGVGFEDLSDAKIWFAMGAVFHPKVVDLAVEAAEEWNLWDIGGEEYAGLKGMAQLLHRLGLLRPVVANLALEFDGALLSEVNKVTYQTPDYMLSTAQDYRPGEMGYQQHIWQATLGPYAVVFVTNPGSLREDTHRPNYWAGNSRLPRNAQYRNLMISWHDIDRNRGILEPRHFAFTHAYFPRWAFDEVREIELAGGGGWIFGRKGDGYVALYSHLPYEWQQEGPDAGQEIIAPGRQNVWICLLGRREIDGSFTEFKEAVSGAPLEVEEMRVEFDAPGVGKAAFGWSDSLTVNGEEISLDGYPRWDNPYSHVPFNSRVFDITHEGNRLYLDFENLIRKIE